MDSNDPRAFEYALGMIESGSQFEVLAQDLMACLVGRDFRPLGGHHDRGVDGLEQCSTADGQTETIYQMSIEKNPAAKLKRTVATLLENQIPCKRLVYVTNQPIPDALTIEESLYSEYGIVVQCRDMSWLRGQVYAHPDAKRVYHSFLERELHELARAPQEDFLVLDYAKDPRVFVFLRQQWEEYRNQYQLEEVIADSLILLALEGTDPDEGILRSREEIRNRILALLTHSALIDHYRLVELSTKPREFGCVQ